MIPDIKKGPPGPEHDIIITTHPNVWVSEKGKLLPCPIGKFGTRLAIMLGEPGAKFAYAVARQLDFYRSSEEAELHREFERRVVEWSDAANLAVDSALRAAGTRTGLYAPETAPVIPSPILPPRPFEPAYPPLEALCSRLENGCAAHCGYYVGVTYISGPCFIVKLDYSLWYLDSEARDTSFRGVYWKTSEFEIMEGPRTLEGGRYIVAWCGDYEWLEELEGKFGRVSEAMFSRDGHSWIFVRKEEIVYGPGWFWRCTWPKFCVEDYELAPYTKYFVWTLTW